MQDYDGLTQRELLRQHMDEIGPITKLEALRKYGIMNVGERVRELKIDDYPLGMRKITVEKASGKKTRVAEYYNMVLFPQEVLDL